MRRGKYYDSHIQYAKVKKPISYSGLPSHSWYWGVREFSFSVLKFPGKSEHTQTHGPSVSWWYPLRIRILMWASWISTRVNQREYLRQGLGLGTTVTYPQAVNWGWKVYAIDKLYLVGGHLDGVTLVNYFIFSFLFFPSSNIILL